MKTIFKGGSAFLLQEEMYAAMLEKIEFFANPKNPTQTGRNFFFIILDHKELEEGEGSSFGKQLKALFWANSVQKDGTQVFAETGKHRVCCENLLAWKGIDHDEWVNSGGETDDLIGCVVRLGIANTEKDGKKFSNIDTNVIKKVNPKNRDRYLAQIKKVKQFLAENQIDDDDDFADEPKQKIEVKKRVQIDDNDFADEPKQKIETKKKVQIDDDFADEPKQKIETKKKVQIDDDDFADEPKQKIETKKKVQIDDDDDDLFD